MSKKGKAKGEKDEAKKSAAAVKPKADAVVRNEEKPDQDQRFTLISKALADPTRMSILRRIAAGAGRCGDVKECLGVSAATLSHHLKELEHAGLVTLNREGRFVHASIEKKVWKQYVAALKSLMP